MSDSCHLRDLKIPCIIGIDPWEETVTQVIMVDVTYPIAVATAAAQDDITQTVDYRSVADGIYAAHQEQRFHLLETLTESIARWVLQNTAVAWVEIAATKTIDKTAAKTATIRIRRDRPPV